MTSRRRPGRSGKVSPSRKPSIPRRPQLSRELLIAIYDHPEWAAEHAEPVYEQNPSQLQVHVVGTAKGLRSLGEYLIALASHDPGRDEIAASLDEIPFADGGTIRLLPRRLAALPAARPRTDDYRSGFLRVP
jgi:hypothetical protein